MHVLIVLHNLEIGGAERMALRLTAGLVAAGERVTVASMGDGGALEGEFCQSKATLLANIITHRFDIRGLWHLARYIDSAEVDAVVLVDVIGDVMFYGFVASRLARRKPAVVGWVHNTPDIGYRPLEFINRMLSRQLDVAVAVSRPARDAHLRQRIIPESRWAVVVNSFDSREYQTTLAPAEARRQLGLPQDRLLVGMVGNFYAHKDQPLLIEAMAEVLRRGKVSFDLAFAGDGDKLQQCRELACKLGIGDHVHFLGRITQIPLFLRSLDLFTLISHHEGFGLAVMEAMAAGLPVVASDLPALREGLKMGMLVSPHDVTALSDTLEELLERPNLRRMLGLAGQQYVSELNGLSMVQQFQQVLHLTVRERSARAAEMRYV